MTNFNLSSLPVFQEFETHLAQYGAHLRDNSPLPANLYSFEDLLGLLTVENHTLVLRKKSNTSPLSSRFYLERYCLSNYTKVIAAYCADQHLQTGYFPYPLVIALDHSQAQNNPIFLPLTILVNELDNPLIQVHHSQRQGDLDYECHVWLANEFRTLRLFSDEEKFNNFPYSVGSILVLHTKVGRLSPSAPWGSISSSVLVKLLDITEEGILISRITIQGTLEDSLTDFLQLPLENRYRFASMLQKVEESKPKLLPYSDFGVDYSMFNETHLLTGLSDKRDDQVLTHIYDGSEVKTYKLQEADLVYFCLKQNGIEVDRELFLKNNPHLSSLAWETVPHVNPHPILQEAVSDSCYLP